jgi:uracil-DNA glycosylase
MGLSFSVPQGQKVPSSLQNIFKELGTDLGCGKPTHGDLDKWATQGVLMINASLTVRAHTANSHSKKGWEIFTAQEKKKLIGKEGGHLILECPHPSGLSAHRGFYGCKHFSQANAFIESNGGAHIDWQIEPHNEYVAR